MIRHRVLYAPSEPPGGTPPTPPGGEAPEVTPDINDWATFAASGRRPGDTAPVATPGGEVAPAPATEIEPVAPPAPPASVVAPAAPGAPAAPAATAPLAPTEPLILGKYKTTEEVLAAFNNLQEEKATLEKLLTVARPTVASPTGPRAPAAAPGAPAPPAAPAFRVTKEQVAGLYEKPEEVLSSLGTALYQQAVRDALTLVDEYIGERERLQSYAKTSHQVYYARYKHHVGREKFVGAIAKEVQSENPGKWPHELIDDIAKRVDTELAKMGIVATPATPSVPSVPPPPGGVRPTPPKMTEQEKEMADLLH